MHYEGAYVDKVEGRIVVDTAPPSAFPYSIDVDEVAEGVTQVEYPDGTVMVCELDGQASGETVKRCTVGGAESLSVSRYATVSQPAALTLGAGALYRGDTYDERSRLTERTYAWDAALAPETVAFKHAYNYTGGDREVWREITRRATRQGAAAETHDFARYDADGRLRWTEKGATATTAASGNLVVFPSFALAALSGTLPPTATASAADDVVGNRNFLQGLYGRTYSFTGDRLTSVATRGTGPAMAPDTAFDRFARTQTQDRDSLGNIQTLPHPNGTLTLTYDGFSRLIGIAQATAQGTIEYTYRYRVDGLLQEKKRVCGAVPNCVSAHELYLYDHRGYLLEIRDVELGNAVVAQYYYASFDAEVPVAMKLDGQMYYPAVDRQGSVMRLVDSAGNVVEEVSYDAFGQPTVTAPTMSVSQSQSHVQNRLLFQSHLWDADVGLYFMRARVFDPYLGHFLQRDPSGYVDSVNLYAGFTNDPVNFKDPSGRTAEEQARLDQCLANIADYWTESFEQRCRDENPVSPPTLLERGGNVVRGLWDWLLRTDAGQTVARLDTSLRETAELNVSSAVDDLVDQVRSDRIDYALSDTEIDRTARHAGAELYQGAREFVTGALTGRAIEIAGSVFLVAAVRVDVRGLPVMYFRRSQLPELAENIDHAQRAGHPTVLTYAGLGETFRRAQRRRATASPLPRRAGTGMSWDEYPFASTHDGGSGAWVGAVPVWQQNAQRNIIANFVTRNRLKPGDRFVVRVID